MLNLNYVFEKMSPGNYQVRLCGEFIAYTNHKDPLAVDLYLNELGYASREEYLNANTKDNLIEYLYFFYEKAGIYVPDHLSFEPSINSNNIHLWDDDTETILFSTESVNEMIDYIYNNQLFEE
jgi:hypothetical protein